MIVRMHTQTGSATLRRSAFTLLEVLVVVAIIVVLATVSTVYIFGYLEDGRRDAARQQAQVLEKACKAYMAKAGVVGGQANQPPGSLQQLVAPEDGSRPLVEGGLAALNDPWGKPYQYNPSNTNNYGDPDPMVYTTDKDGKQVLALGR